MGRMRHGMWFLFALSFLIVSCLGWILEKPSFVLREIILTPRSFKDMSLLLGLEIQNPNRFDLTLKSFECNVYLDKEEIGNGRLEKEVLIPSSTTTRAQVPVAVKIKDLSGILKAVITGDKLPYRIEGKADIKTVFGSLYFPFSKEGRLN